MRADIEDHAVFANEISHDRFRHTPADQLLTGLRGKDVLLVFVESYGQVAVQGSSFSPQVDAGLDKGTKRLQAAGFSARSAFLTSPTFGGISWLAHSTLQSGALGQQPAALRPARREQPLHAQRRVQAGRVADRRRRAVERPDWPQGTSFYHYDKLYDRRNVGYHGPTFAYASMPDQYIFSALQRLELAKPDRRPVFAEVDLVSSHTPWTRIPQLIAWNEVGDGSVFNRMPVDDQLTGRALERPDTGTGGVRPVDRVLAERPGLVRAALRRQRTSCWSSWATTSPRRSSAAGPEPRRADLGHRPRPGGAGPDRRLGLGATACGPARRRRSGR